MVLWIWLELGLRLEHSRLAAKYYTPTVTLTLTVTKRRRIIFRILSSPNTKMITAVWNNAQNTSKHSKNVCQNLSPCWQNTLLLDSIPALCYNIEKTWKITIEQHHSPYLSLTDGMVCLHTVARLVFRIFNGFATKKISKLANHKCVLKVTLPFWALPVIICTHRC